MKAFINCKYTKEQAVALAWQHYKQDQYLKGTYGDGEYGTTEFKGCSVGCMANGLHSNYPELFGVIPQIAYLSDAIFEGLNIQESALWTPQLFEAIQVGSDTKSIFHKFMHFILVDPKHGVNRFSDCKEIKHVADLHLKAASGEEITNEVWTAARAALTLSSHTLPAHTLPASAAANTHPAAAHTATEHAADASYATDASARAAAATDAASTANARAAREKHYQIMRDKLIQLFENGVA